MHRITVKSGFLTTLTSYRLHKRTILRSNTVVFVQQIRLRDQAHHKEHSKDRRSAIQHNSKSLWLFLNPKRGADDADSLVILYELANRDRHRTGTFLGQS